MNLRYRRVLLGLLGALYIFLFILRVEVLLYTEAHETLSRFADKVVVVKGVVVSDPDRRDTSLHANIRVSEVQGAPASGTLLAILDRSETPRYGDTLELSGTLAVPQPFETDTGHTFDYTDYLRVQGVSMTLQKANVLSDARAGFSLQGSLFDLKHWFESSLERLFPEPDNSLLEGILLGERGGIPKGLNNAFVSSGLVHVVALSGYNISIVAIGVFSILGFLPRTASFSVGGIVMILFALMTGAGATTVRALIMAIIALTARYLGRSALALRSLCAAALAMALWNPLILLFDPSFILSVLATFGLITLVPWVEKYLPKFLSRYPSLREIAASTIAVQIFVLPALLYFTGVFSFLSVPANALALPVVPWAMLAGFIAGLLGMVHPVLGYVPALICDVLLKWIMFIAYTTASIPFATAVVPAFGAWIVAVLYIPLTWFATLQYWRIAPRKPTN